MSYYARLGGVPEIVDRTYSLKANDGEVYSAQMTLDEIVERAHAFVNGESEGTVITDLKILHGDDVILSWPEVQLPTRPAPKRPGFGTMGKAMMGLGIFALAFWGIKKVL